MACCFSQKLGQPAPHVKDSVAFLIANSEVGDSVNYFPLTQIQEMKGDEDKSTVPGQRSNQLNYVPTRQINEMRNNQCLCRFARFAYVAHIAQDDLNCSYFGLNPP